MKDITSYHCKRTLPVFNSGDTIFILFFFIIGGIGLVCDKQKYVNIGFEEKHYNMKLVQPKIAPGLNHRIQSSANVRAGTLGFPHFCHWQM